LNYEAASLRDEKKKRWNQQNDNDNNNDNGEDEKARCSFHSAYASS